MSVSRSVLLNRRVARHPLAGLTAALLALGWAALWAAPYNGDIIEIQQPDDTKVQVRVWGDEFHGVMETLDGYTVVKDRATDEFRYARLTADGKSLVPTDRVVRPLAEAGAGPQAARGAPADVDQHLRISRQAARQIHAANRRLLVIGPPPGKQDGPQAAKDPEAERPDSPTVGQRKGLTILIEFPDRPGDVSITQTQVDSFCNQETGYSEFGNNGSVYQYFYEASNGQLEYTNHVTAYYTAANNRSYYTDDEVTFGYRARELVEEALDALEDADFDFETVDLDNNGIIDGINAFYAGSTVNGWSEGLWPHAWTVYWNSAKTGISSYKYQITNMGSSLTLGTFCHENGHMLCDFPDIYDYDGDSIGGAGKFCLMNSGGHGTNPAIPCAPLRFKAGWADASTTEVEGQHDQTHTLTSRTGTVYNNEFVLYKKDNDEYFIVEYIRDSHRGTSYYPGSGLAVWLVDEDGDRDDQRYAYNTSHQNYAISLIQADGDFDFQKGGNSGELEDLFHADHADISQFDDDSTPAAKWWDGTDSTMTLSEFGDTSGNPASMSFRVRASGPEIRVTGGGNEIVDGDTSPATADDTDFADIVLGADDSHTFTIANTGSLPLTISGNVSLSGSHSGDFAVTSQPSGTIGAAGSDTFTVRFTPSATGLREATVTLSSDDPDEGTYSFAIQGTGTMAEIVVRGNGQEIADGDTTPATADDTDFADIVLGADDSHTFTIANTGTGNLTVGSVTVGGSHSGDFAVTAQPSSPVADSGSTTFTVQFTPGATGLREATLSFANSDGDESPYTFAIQGTGVTPEIAVRGQGQEIASGDTTPSTTDDTDFGEQGLSGTTDHVFTIHNTGTSDLTLGGDPKVAVTGTHAADFTVQVQPSSPVAASGDTTFTVRFAPSATGVRIATVSIASDDSDEDPYTFAIQGTGVDREIYVAGESVEIPDGSTTPLTDTDYGDVGLGYDKQNFFGIRNEGTTDLTLSGDPKVVIGGTHAADFEVIEQPESPLAGGEWEFFTIKFTPSGTGLRTATVSIANDDADENPYDFVIQGTAIDPEIAVSGNGTDIADGDTTPATADDTDFAEVALGAAHDHTFTIANTGTTELTFSQDVSLGGTDKDDFEVTAQPTGPVAAGAETTFTVRFTPGALGTRMATVRIRSNDPDEVIFDFALQGTGVTPEIVVSGNSQEIANGDATPSTTDDTEFGELVLGALHSHTFTIGNTGTAELLLTGDPKVVVSGPHAADFTVTATPASPVSAGDSTAFLVTFTPSALGVRQATLTIANSDLDEASYAFALQGTGIAPEIEVTGQGQEIVSGDATPSTTDDTDYGQVLLGGSHAHTFTVANSGTANLALTGDPAVQIGGTHAGDFAVTLLPASSVAPGGSSPLGVVFTPSAVGLRTATVTVTSDDADENPYTFAVSGTGVTPEIVVSGGGLEISNGDDSPQAADGTDFGVVLIGDPMAYTFAIGNTGTGELTLDGSPKVALTGPNAADFSVTVQPPSPVAPSGQSTFTVTCSPTGDGAISATVSIPNSDLDEAPYTFTVQALAVPTYRWEVSLGTGQGTLVVDAQDALPDFAWPFAAGEYDFTFTEDFPEDTAVSLTATPAPGWIFDHWSGDLAQFGTNPQISTTATADVTGIAHFRRDPHARDLTGDGRPDLVIQDPEDLSQAQVLELSGGSLAGRHDLTLPVARERSPRAVADFNADGIADLVFQNADGSVGVYELAADGTIAATRTLYGSALAGWWVCAAGDLDGDATPEVILQSTGYVVVWHLDGYEVTGYSLLTAGVGAGWLARALMDYDGDDELDLVWQNTDSGEVWYWRLVDGAFGGAGGKIDALSNGWWVCGAADLNDDDEHDLLVANGQGGLEAHLFAGATRQGTLTYTGFAPGHYPVGVGQVMGTAQPEAFSADAMRGLQLVTLPTADGAVTAQAVNLPTRYDVEAWMLGDFNADQIADVVHPTGDGRVVVSYLDANQQVSGQDTLFQGDFGTWEVRATGDLDGDGDADLVWQDETYLTIVWLMDGTTQTGSVILGYYWPVVDCADLNGDGRDDLLSQGPSLDVVNRFSAQLGHEAAAVIRYHDGSETLIGAADFTGDGQAELLLRGDTGLVARELGADTLYDGARHALPDHPQTHRFIGLGDLDADGQQDLVWQGANHELDLWLMQDATRQSRQASALGGAMTFETPRLVGTGDTDDDGVDELYYQLADGRVGYLHHQNYAATSAVALYPGTTTWQVQAVYDLDEDYAPDLLWQSNTGEAVVWYGGSAANGRSVYPFPLAGWRLVDAGDVDRDGSSDILLQNTDGVLALWKLDANGTLASGLVYGSHQQRAGALGYFGGDNVLNLALQDLAAGTLNLLPLPATVSWDEIPGKLTDEPDQLVIRP